MAVIQVTEDNFDEVVMKSEKPVLLDFYADWCGPCKMMSPVVEQIAEKYASEYRAACRKIAAERNDFIAKLAKFKFLKVYPSAANFVLCEVKKPYTSKKLVMELWTRAGCLVKDCSGKKGFEGKSFIRIAVKSAADNAQFIAALKELK